MEYLKKAQAAHIKLIAEYKKLSESLSGKALADAQAEAQPALFAASELSRKAEKAAAIGITDADLLALSPLPPEKKPTKKK